MLKVVSVISGPKINDHIHLIFPNDPLAAHPMSSDILCLCVCVD